MLRLAVLAGALAVATQAAGAATPTAAAAPAVGAAPAAAAVVTRPAATRAIAPATAPAVRGAPSPASAAHGIAPATAPEVQGAPSPVSAAPAIAPAQAPAAPGVPSAASPTPAPPMPGRARGPNPHAGPDGKPVCARCHAPGERTVKGDPIALCAGCHDAGLMRHPFRIQLEQAPEGLPLMPGRFVACHTCHDPHAVTARRSGLRLEYGELCMRCHTGHGPKHPAPAASSPAR